MSFRSGGKLLDLKGGLMGDRVGISGTQYSYLRDQLLWRSRKAGSVVGDKSAAYRLKKSKIW